MENEAAPTETTPRPWRFHHWGNQGGDYSILANVDGKDTSVTHTGDHDDMAPTEADMKLIVAAVNAYAPAPPAHQLADDEKVAEIRERLVPKRQSRQLPSGAVFTRNRCSGCNAHWDTGMPGSRDEEEHHQPDCKNNDIHYLLAALTAARQPVADMKAAMIARVLEGGFEYSDGDGLRDVDLRGLIAIADELKHVEPGGPQAEQEDKR